MSTEPPNPPRDAERLLESHYDPVFSSLRVLGLDLHRFACQCFGLARGESKDVHDFRLAVQEAATNLIEHGRLESELRVWLELRGDELSLSLVSRGVYFDPTVREAVLPDADDLAEGGYGLFLIRALTDDVRYHTEDGWNRLVLRKRIRAEECAA